MGYPPPAYYPPPRKDNTALIIVVVVVVLVVAVPVVLAGILYIMVSGLIGAPGPSRPLIGMTLQQNTTSGADLLIVSVQGPNAPGDFRVDLYVDGSIGTAVPFPLTSGSLASITVSSTVYGFTWNDVDRSATLSAGDILAVTYPSSGGPGAGAQVTLALLWMDGTLVSQTSWAA